jgi:hypothetical protein
MYPGHLTELAKAGRWEETFQYLSRFLKSDRLLSIHGRALLRFLRVHKAIDDIIAEAPEGRAVCAALMLCFTLDDVRSKGIVKLYAILWTLVCYGDKWDSTPKPSRCGLLPNTYSIQLLLMSSLMGFLVTFSNARKRLGRGPFISLVVYSCC